MMISTVTTTVSTIVSSSAAIGLMGSITLSAVCLLLALLIFKGLAINKGVSFRYFALNLRVIIPSLLLVFAFVLSMKVWEILT